MAHYTISYSYHQRQKTITVTNLPGGKFSLLVDGRRFCHHMTRPTLESHLWQYRRLGATLSIVGPAPTWIRRICKDGDLFEV